MTKPECFNRTIAIRLISIKSLTQLQYNIQMNQLLKVVL